MALKILLADDSMVAQSMGKKILADAGYEVAVVSNGAAALKQLSEVQPDIILLDVYMPGYTGLEVCQKVKSAPETARTPVLLTVGMLEPFRPEDGIRARADGVIVKPFEASDLIALVAKIAERIPLERRQAAGMAKTATPAAADTASGVVPPVHAKGREFPRLGDAAGGETVAEEAPHVPGSSFAAAQAMMEQAEADTIPAVQSRTTEQAGAVWDIGKSLEVHEADPHADPLKDAEAAAGVAASALAALSWQEILSGAPRPGDGEAERPHPVETLPGAESTAEEVQDLEPTLQAATTVEGSAEPALISDLHSADWLRGALVSTDEAEAAENAPATATTQGPDLAAQEEVLRAAMYGSAAAAQPELQRFPPVKAEEETAATLPELQPTLEPSHPAEVAPLPELEQFDQSRAEPEKTVAEPEEIAAPAAAPAAEVTPVLDEAVAATEDGESAEAIQAEAEPAAEPAKAEAEIVAEPAPELAETLVSNAGAEEDFLQIGDESQLAAVPHTETPEDTTPAAAEAESPELVSALEALTAAEAVNGAEPRVEATEDSGPDAAAIALAEQIVDRVLERVRPELVKEVARLVN